MMLGLGLGVGFSRAPGAAAFDPTTLSSFRSQYLGGALQTDTAGHNNYTVVGSPTSGTQNGHATTIFNGSTDRLNLAAFSLGATGTGVTVAMAAKVISSDATSRQIFALTDTASGFLFGTSHGHLNVNDLGAEIEGPATISGAWKRIIMTDISGANGQKGYVNGVLDVQQTGSASINDNLPSQVANYFSFCNIEIGQILVFSADLSGTADLANVDSYLSTKWAI